MANVWNGRRMRRVWSRLSDCGVASDATDGCAVNAEEAGDVGGGTAGAEHGENFGLLLRGELGLAPASAALSACRRMKAPSP